MDIKNKEGKRTFRTTGKNPAKQPARLKPEVSPLNNPRRPKSADGPLPPHLSAPKSVHVMNPSVQYTVPNPQRVPRRKLTRRSVQIIPLDRFHIYPAEQQLFTTADVGAIFEVSSSTVRRAISDGYIYAYREGLYWQIPRKEVERMILEKYWK